MLKVSKADTDLSGRCRYLAIHAVDLFRIGRYRASRFEPSLDRTAKEVPSKTRF